MHIVYVTREYPPTKRGGGIASYVKDMACHLVRKGHTVTVVAASDDTRMESYYVEDGVNIIRLSKGDFVIPSIEKSYVVKKLRCVYRFYSYRKKVRDVIKGLKDVDLVEVPEFGAEGYYLNDLNIPVVIRLHTPSYLDRATFGKKKYKPSQFHEWFYAEKEKTTLCRGGYISSCSESLKQWIVDYFDMDADLIKVIYNPIHVQNWISDKTFTAGGKSVRILFCGTVAKEKGIGDLVEACKLLKAENIDVRLTVAGKMGQYGEALKSSLAGEQWCRFLGNVRRDELLAAYSANEIACFPSWWENMPIVCLESMASRTLTIGSRAGGMAEIITDGVDGFLIEPKNPVGLAQKIKEVHCLSKEKKDEIRRNAREKVQEGFDIENVGEQMLTYYNRVIRDFKSPKTSLG